MPTNERNEISRNNKIVLETEKDLETSNEIYFVELRTINVHLTFTRYQTLKVCSYKLNKQ